MKVQFASIFLFFLLFFVFGIGTAQACSCVKQDVCQYYASVSVVFIGKVIESTERVKTVTYRERSVGGKEWEENKYAEKRQISRLQVDESFLGTNKKTEVVIETEISSSCGLPLEKDASYIIYATKNENEENLMTYFCSGTRRISYAKKHIKYLRANKKKPARVFGKISFGEYGKINLNQLRKYDVNTVSLENDERQFRAIIKLDGYYDFVNIPSGKYKIKVVIPETLTIDGDYHPDIAEGLGIGDQSVIEVSKRGCSVKDFLIKENGRISGRLTDARGNPVEDISVYLIPLSKTGEKIEQEELCYDTGLCLDTDQNGCLSSEGIGGDGVYC